MGYFEFNEKKTLKHPSSLVQSTTYLEQNMYLDTNTCENVSVLNTNEKLKVFGQKELPTKVVKYQVFNNKVFAFPLRYYRYNLWLSLEIKRPITFTSYNLVIEN